MSAEMLSKVWFRYLAGFITLHYTNLKLGYNPDYNKTSFSWATPLFKGGIQKPSKEFLTKCKELYKIFQNYNGDPLGIEK